MHNMIWKLRQFLVFRQEDRLHDASFIDKLKLVNAWTCMNMTAGLMTGLRKIQKLGIGFLLIHELEFELNWRMLNRKKNNGELSLVQTNYKTIMKK